MAGGCPPGGFTSERQTKGATHPPLFAINTHVDVGEKNRVRQPRSDVESVRHKDAACDTSQHDLASKPAVHATTRLSSN